jgi:hypothetical protein
VCVCLCISTLNVLFFIRKSERAWVSETPYKHTQLFFLYYLPPQKAAPPPQATRSLDPAGSGNRGVGGGEGWGGRGGGLLSETEAAMRTMQMV